MKKGLIIGGVIIILLSIFSFYRYAIRNTLNIVAPGTYEVEDNIENIVVKASDVVIINANVSNDVTITKKAKEGKITIRDSKIAGKLLINGSINDIHIESTKIKIINANHKKLKMIIDEESQIKTLNANLLTKLQISGKVNTLNVNEDAKGSKITVEKEALVSGIYLNALSTLNTSSLIDEILLREKAEESILNINSSVIKLDTDVMTNINLSEKANISNLIATSNATNSIILANKGAYVRLLGTDTLVFLNGEGAFNRVITNDKNNIKGNANYSNISIVETPILNNSNGNTINAPIIEDKPVVIIPEFTSLNSISFNETAKTMKYGDVYKLNVSYIPVNASNKKVFYTSSDVNVASVDENGIIKATGKGTATIKATSENNAKTTEIIITVELGTINILSTKITNYNTMEVMLENSGDYTFKINDIDTKYTVFENTYTLTINNFEDINKLEINKDNYEPIIKNDILKLDNMVIIKTTEDLKNAVNNQKDDQIWLIREGVYNTPRFDTITLLGQTGWYLPLTANNLLIVGQTKDKVVLTSDVVMPNGALATQNFITIVGNNIKLDNLVLESKVETNKVIEVLGMDFALTNSTIRSRADNPIKFAGSIYFNPSNITKTVGNVNIENVNIIDGRITASGADTGIVNMTNVNINYVNVDSNYLNGYYPILAFKGLNKTIVTNVNNLVVTVGPSMTDYMSDMLKELPENTKVILDKGIYVFNSLLVEPIGITIDKTLATIHIKDSKMIDNAAITSWYGVNNEFLDTSINLNFDNLKISDIKSIKFELINNDVVLGTALSTGTNLVNLLKDAAIYWGQTADTYLETKGLKTLSNAFKTRTVEEDNKMWVRSICTAENKVVPNKLHVEVELLDGTIYIVDYNK